MLVLLRATTGENWHLILEAISKENTMYFKCKVDPTYEDFKVNGF